VGVGAGAERLGDEPDRSECLPNKSTCAAVYPAAAARRWIIAATASPVNTLPGWPVL